ncbi:hypothetical protein ABK040_013489 [Willaertia magna]
MNNKFIENESNFCQLNKQQQNTILNNNSHQQQQQQQNVLFHGIEHEEHDDDDELLQHHPIQHMIAGALAGLGEHTVMYPVDTIKSRVQALNQGLIQSIKNIGSLRNFYSGLSIVLYGAIPSHALYFATYEAFKVLLQSREFSQQIQKQLKFTQKDKINDNNKGKEVITDFYLNTSMSTSAISGIMATIAHDTVGTPCDVIKQHMQLKGHTSHYNFITATREIYKLRGMRAFFVSLPTTILMNIPYTSVQFMTYEWMKRRLFSESFTLEHRDQDKFKHLKHFVSGGIAGAAAGLVSNPFDVVKTYLQVGYGNNVKDVLIRLQSEKGGLLKGLFRGSIPRIVYFAPSAAVTWSTYEYIKYFFRLINQDDHSHDHNHDHNHEHSHEHENKK